MAEETLVEAQDVQEDVDAVDTTEAPSGDTLTREQVLTMVAEGREQAIREASEKASRQSQSLVDKATARTRQEMQSEIEVLMDRTGQVLADHGAEPETIEGLRLQTQRDLEIRGYREKAEAYDKLKAETEAAQQREDYIVGVCAEYNIPRYHKDLVTNVDQPTFDRSVLDIRMRRLERKDKDDLRVEKKKNLEAMREAGQLDVTGGGASMVPATWSTNELVLGSEESIISDHVIGRFGNMTIAKLGQRIKKAQQLMRSDPRYANNPKMAVGRMYDDHVRRG